MKKNIIFTILILAAALSGKAQEKMNLLMKDGSVVSYHVDDIQSFYFTDAEQEPQVAENCGITINDELTLTDKFALDLIYEPGIEYVRVGVYFPENYNDDMSDEALLEGIIRQGASIDKNTTVVTASNMPEGSVLTVVYTGYNSQGQHGPVYRHKLRTHVQANEPKAVVTSCQFSSTKFIFNIAMDATNTKSYYLFEEVSNDYPLMHTAAFGLLWRQAIATEPMKGLYSNGDTFTMQRPNGEKQLFVATWALDNNSQYSGYIFEGLYDASASSHIRSLSKAYSISENNIKAYNKEELMAAIKNINYKIVRH